MKNNSTNYNTMQALLPSLSFIKKTVKPLCLRFCTLLLFISFLGIKEVKGQTTLAAGDLAIVGVIANGTPDKWSFVCFKDLSAGTIIYFTDNGWTGSQYRGASSTGGPGNEGLVKFTVASGQTVLAGTLINSNETSSLFTWTTSGSIGLSGNYTALALSAPNAACPVSSSNGDQVCAFQSSNSTNPLWSPTNLFVFDYTGAFETASTSNSGDLPSGCSGVTVCNSSYSTGNYLFNSSATARTGSTWNNYFTTSSNFTGASSVTLPTTASTSITVLANEPTAASTSLNTNGTTPTSLSVGWTNPVSNGGAKRIVVLRASSTAAVAPTDNTTYTTTSTFGSGSGTQITGAGNYVIYNGSGNSVTGITVTASTSYVVDIYEYNGGDAGTGLKENYFATAANNSFATPSSGTTNVALATTGTPSSANLGTGSNKLIYGFSLTPSGGSVNFTALNITTSGSALASDISAFDLYYDADASGTINVGDVLVKTVSTLANPLAFSSFSNAQTGLADGTTYRYLVQAIVAGSPTNGRTITLSIASTGDITTNATGSVSGTPLGNTMYVGNPSSITNNTGTPSASNVTKAATDFLVFGFQLTPTGLVDFTAVNIATVGTATSNDLSNFRLYKDANNNGVYDNGTDILIQTVSTLSSTLSFSSLSQTGLTAATNYLLIADIAGGATTGRTFTASIAASSDIILTSGSNTGTAAGNQMTIDAGTFGDFRSNGTGGGAWSSTSTWQTYSATGTWGAASVAPTTTSYVTKDVTILSGDVVTVTGTSNYCKNLTVQGSGGKLFSNQVATTTFINVYGDITCNGTIGNGSIYDAIGFDVEGSSCTISGSGTFDAARIAKNSITSPAATTTNLTFDMNANLRYGGAGSGSQSSNNTSLYNNIAGSVFNIVINSSKTLTCMGDGTATAAAAVSIDGTDGTGSGERGGSITVNGTLDIQYNGTPAGSSPTFGLYLTTNNATSAVSVSIGASGIINTPRIVCSASGLAGHNFSIASGGVLNITNEPATFITPSNTNNTYTLNPNSNINYNKAGAQTIYTFGSSVQYGNLMLTGSGNKTIPATLSLVNTLTVGVNTTLTTAGNLTLKSNATATARIAQSAGSISGDVNVERYIPQNSNRAWRTLSVPTYSNTQTIASSWQSGTLITGPASCTGMDATTNGYSMYTYNASTDNLVGVSSTASAINSNSSSPASYFLYVRGDRTTGLLNANTNPSATTLSTTGSVYQGQVSIDISANNASAAITYHLIGNPYVSPININNFLTNANNTNNIENTIYVWDPKMTNTASGVGGIVTLTSNGSAYDPNTSGLSYANGTTELPSGMAFFVQKKSSNCTNCSLVFTESMKSSGAITPNGFKTTSGLDGRMQINLEVKINDSTQGVADGLLALYDAQADMQVSTSEDALKMSNFGENMSIRNGTNLLAIEKRPLRTIDTLAIQTDGLLNRAYTLVFNPSQFDAGVKAQLIDHYLNLTYPIATLNKTTYAFSVDANAASKASNRFELLYNNQNALSITNTLQAANIQVYPNPTDGKVNIAMHSASSGNYHAQVFNAFGASVVEQDFVNDMGNSISIDLSAQAKGVYYLKISNAQHEQVVVKIIHL